MEIADTDQYIFNLSLDEARQALILKNKKESELLNKQHELEKMLEEKDEEILELMQEVNRFQEQTSQAQEVPVRKSHESEKESRKQRIAEIKRIVQEKKTGEQDEQPTADDKVKSDFVEPSPKV